MSTQFERIITLLGIVAAIIVAAVVLFVFSRLTGLFRQGTSQPETSVVAQVTESTADTVMDIHSDSGLAMPNVLGLPQDMAREKLKERGLVMEVTGSQYSDNYPEGQVMGQDIPEGTEVKKWSTVGVTVSKGSDKIDVSQLELTGKTAEEAKGLLESKELKASIKEENSDQAEKGTVIRFSPQEARWGFGPAHYQQRAQGDRGTGSQSPGKKPLLRRMPCWQRRGLPQGRLLRRPAIQWLRA